MRIDKLLSEMNIGTRSQIKDFIRQKRVKLNGKIVGKPEQQVREGLDEILFDDHAILYEPFQYFLLNKPQGVVSATRDTLSETVLSLLPKDHRNDLFPVGRLDKDTEGLLLISNDGALSHQLLSPKRHVSKTYLARLAKPLGETELIRLEEGVDIGVEEATLPAVAIVPRMLEEGNWLRLSIQEGRYHQVKRMLESIGNEVLYLKRIRFGSLLLDENMPIGACRKLTENEVSLLREYAELQSRKKEMLPGKKAVIFDLDGSLIDSMWVWSEIDEEYLAKWGLCNIDRAVLRAAIEGMTFHETAVYFKEHFEIEDDIEKIKADWRRMAWDKYEQEVLLKPGVYEFLKGCKKNKIRLGIATSNSRELAESVLRSNKVFDDFEVIVTGSEAPKGKPAPDIYLSVASKLSVPPKECLVFEDTLAGIQAGLNAGMTVCAVSDPDSEVAWPRIRKLADYFADDFYDFF